MLWTMLRAYSTQGQDSKVLILPPHFLAVCLWTSHLPWESQVHICSSISFQSRGEGKMRRGGWHRNTEQATGSPVAFSPTMT